MPRKTVRHSSCFKGYLLSVRTNRALAIPVSQTGNWVTARLLPESGRRKDFTPSLSSLGENVGYNEPSEDVLDTYHVLERQVNRNAKPWPFKSSLGAAHTWQVPGLQMSLQVLEGKPTEGGNAGPCCVNGCMQQVARSFAVHNSFTISGAAGSNPVCSHVCLPQGEWKPLVSAWARCCEPASATIYHFGKRVFSEAQGKNWLPDMHLGETGLYRSGEYSCSLVSFLLI